MATTRINAVSATATTFAGDDFLPIDGNVNATRRILVTSLFASASAIGSVTPAAGTFTSLSGTNINGTLGATTPSSVAATTGTFSSTLGVTGVATLASGVFGSADLSTTDTGAVALKVGKLAATPTNGINSYIAAQTTGGPGVTNGDLIYIPRSTSASNAAHRFFTESSGTPTLRVLIDTAGAAITGTTTSSSDVIISSGNYLRLKNTANSAFASINFDGTNVTANYGLAITGIITASNGTYNRFATANSGDTVASLVNKGSNSAYLTIASGTTADYVLEMASERTGASTGNFYFGGNHTTNFIFRSNGYATLGNWNSTALSVTGALSTTAGANFATSSGSVGIGTASPSYKLDVNSTTDTKLLLTGSTNQNGMRFGAASSANEYYIAAGNNLASSGDKGFIIYNITASQPQLFIEQATRNVSVYGEFSAGGALSATGAISTAATGASAMVINSGGAALDTALRINRGSGTYWLVAHDSQGGLTFNRDNVDKAYFGRNGVDGLYVTGTLTCTGALAIGNTVNTVSPTSPNRTITMVIGGTTYYIHAKTTND